MKISLSQKLKAAALASAVCFSGSLQAQDASSDEFVDAGAERIGLMPYQKVPVEVGLKERNPFANRTPEKKADPEELENNEEDRIRVVLSELPISGLSRGKNGLQVLIGDMKMERGAVVPKLLADQTASLMVSLITEEKIEFAWLEKSGSTSRRLVLPIDIEPKVTIVLPGQIDKSSDQRMMGIQEAPSSLRRDSGILGDGIGSIGQPN